ncbi:glucosyltransferase [Amycolatopsis sp. NPDC059090]|uniref:glucosyltransferase n=1 Tax=unclassified Amycolatopsis TaxID=2618356 RepID=UPI00366F99FD
MIVQPDVAGPIDDVGSPPAEPGRRPWRTGAWCAAWLLAATWLQLIRGPGHRAPDVPWAEDASVFVNQALRHSFWDNLFAQHAGYLQVVARLLAQPVRHLPVEWFAAWLALSAAFVVALVSLLVWFLSGKVVQTLWARALLTALVPLLPQAGFEVNGAICDLHWHLAYAAFWVLLVPSKSLRGQIGAAAVVVLAALSDPLTALVLPIAIVGVLRTSRRRLALLAPAAMCAALAVQAWVHFTQSVPFRASPTNVWDLPKIYGLRVVLSAVVGDRELTSVYVPLGLPIVVAVCVLVLAGLAVLLRVAARPARVVAVASLLASVAYLFVSVGLRGTGGVLPRESFGLGDSRYTIVPLLLLWTAVIVLLDQAAARSDPARNARGAGTSALIGIVTAAFLGIQLLSDWTLPTVRSFGPSWSASLRSAEAVCEKPPAERAPQPVPLVAERHGKTSAPIFPGPDDVTIVVAPEPPPGEPLLFGVVLPCSALRK